MLIQNTRFNLFFHKIRNIRKNIFELEDILSDFVKPFTLLPIPDEAMPEIPRISAISKFGHSRLDLAMTNAQLTTNYDDNFNKNWNDCSKYLQKRTDEIYKTLNSFIGENFLFSGLTTEIVFNDLKQEPIALIKNNFFKFKSNIEPFDLNCKITFVIDGTYYVNINFSNFRIGEGIEQYQEIPLEVIEKKHIVGLILEVNDRYKFNYNKNYLSTFKNVERIIEITDDILNNKIDKIINEGVFEI